MTDIAGHPLVPGSELDWLTFYWDITTNSASPEPVTVTKLLQMYAAASPEPVTGQVNAEQLIAEAGSPELAGFMTTRAGLHSVAAP